jgi:hypothetical protein
MAGMMTGRHPSTKDTEAPEMILDNDSDNLPAALSPQAEETFYQMAEAMGFIVTEEEAAALSKLSEAVAPLTEAKNIVKLNKMAKLQSLTVRSALIIAQQRKDPLFAKYAKAAMLKRQIRMMIFKKYGVKAQTTARKLLANAGKRNMVDISQRPSALSNPDTK